MKLTLTDTEAMVDRAYDAPAFLAAEAAQPTTPGEIRRALAAEAVWEDAAEAWERQQNIRAGVALSGYALGLLALVAGLAWLIERLPAGVGSVLAVGGTVGMVWVGLGGRRC